jgi:hypothetical protein
MIVILDVNFDDPRLHDQYNLYVEKLLNLDQAKNILQEQELPELCVFYNWSIDTHEHDEETILLFILVFTKKCSNL